MDIREFTAGDMSTIAESVELVNAVQKVDAPFLHPETTSGFAATMRYGWDGEAPRSFAAWDSGVLAGLVQVSVSDWDNTHLAWVDLVVHPDLRRGGFGSQLLEFGKEQTRAMGRTSLGCNGWDNDATHGFAARHDLPCKGSEINRRQTVAVLDRGKLETAYDEAAAAASSYDLVRIVGTTPENMLDAVADITSAINDAPTDDLDIEDEVFPKERISAYERAQQAKGNRLYRVLARHRATGGFAGHSVVAVESERPGVGHQHDTSVVRGHRGHRLGVLLKADMLRWLAEAEPSLETIDTWNAESNDHMIEVNDLLAYRVLGRELLFQIGV